MDEWDDVIRALALVLMFLFMLRSREALCKAQAPDADQCLRVCMVHMACGGQSVDGAAVEAADEVVITVGKHKGDPDGQGGVANAYAVEENPLCPVCLLKRANRMRPGHFANGDHFLLTLSNDKVLHRDEVVDLLRWAAVALGYPAEALSVISLWAGGATAMWGLGVAVERIKRRGRWQSECWRNYVWEGRSTTES